MLAVTLPDGQHLLWFRAEEQRAVDWGGDPHNKAIAVREGDGVRLSPRRSFERWREIVRNRSAPWEAHHLELVDQLRTYVLEAMYKRAQGELRMAELLQRNLLPRMPKLPRWDLTAHYEPAEGGRIGGDWYDAFLLPDGALIVALGDVAGHGISAAGTMAQLRNALRAYLHEGQSPAGAVGRTNDFAVGLLQGAFATAVVARVDLTDGTVDMVSAGHPLPLLAARDGSVADAAVGTSPAIGVRGVSYAAHRFRLEPGATLVMFSDGLIERRGEVIDDGRARLREALTGLPALGAQAVRDALCVESSPDDETVVSLRRPLD